MSDLLALCKQSIERAGVTDVELVVRRKVHGAARFSTGELDQHMALDEPLVVARVARGRRIAEAQSSMLSQGAIVALIHDAERAAAFVPETAEFRGFAGAGEAHGSPPRFAQATAALTDEERTELVRPVLERIADAGLVAAGLLETIASDVAVVTNAGCARYHRGTCANFKVWATETAGARGASGVGAHLHRDVRALRISEETERAIDRCLRGKNATTLDQGTYDVVFEPHAVAELLEWLSAIGFGAPELEQGSSPMRLGERITGEAITITEDPLDDGDTGFAVPFDREGTPRQKVTLVERGTAKSVLHDRTSASRLGTMSTGSALFPDAGSSGIGSSALHLCGGDAASSEELLRGIKRGLYVCKLHYVNGLLEPPRAVMTGMSRDGFFLVEDGKVTRPIQNLRFTESFIEALARCDARTKELTAVPTWWSDGGAVVTPAIRVRDFAFRGGA
ncbi:TldD/PmbA family protein [soil metagenome]